MAEYPDEHIPYVHGRHLLPIRRQPRRLGNAIHERLFAREDEIRARINTLDDQLVSLSEERRALLGELGSLHEELRPRWVGTCGRRRRVISHEEQLPPTTEQPTMLSGVELRAICLAFLRRARGPLTLRQLHVLVHRAGYMIASWHPVKALADALGHEADVGRVQRVARATYAHRPDDRPDADDGVGRGRGPEPLLDSDLDSDLDSAADPDGSEVIDVHDDDDHRDHNVHDDHQLTSTLPDR